MISAEKKPARRQRKVPEYLVYEMMDGRPIYYRGYRSVLNKTKTFEDIRGCSGLQGIIAAFVVRVLLENLNQEDYWILPNEPGIFLDNRNNLIGDILIFEKSRLKAKDIKPEYVKIPANVAVEMDTKADLSTFTFEEYFKLKTIKLHNFGVDKVIWILTVTKQVIVALPHQDWLIIDWNKDIEIINGITFNIGNYLKENEIELENKSNYYP